MEPKKIPLTKQFLVLKLDDPSKLEDIVEDERYKGYTIVHLFYDTKNEQTICVLYRRPDPSNITLVRPK